MTYGNGQQAKRAEKRKIAGQAGGQGRSAAVQAKAPPQKSSSFHDAYELAKRELDPR